MKPSAASEKKPNSPVNILPPIEDDEAFVTLEVDDDLFGLVDLGKATDDEGASE